MRIKRFIVNKPVIQIDTFSIQPFGFKILLNAKQKLDTTSYQINFATAKLYFQDYKKYLNRKILVKYKVYPEILRRTYYTYDLKAVQKDSANALHLLPPEKHQNIPFDGLKTQGNITRGFNAGNQQSLVMQSGLDLKIEGNISPKLKVKAVLSDDNLPQAYAGISQSYKEFNRIYLQLEAPKWIATGGDLLLKEKPGYFLKFNRKSQGLNLQMGKDSAQMQITAGVIQGQFGINRFNGIDGNQGPYVLKGNQGESYIFIIPDSEKVYVNGKKLTRGENKDYTINYETAELRFNPSFPITQNQRITVEFNYANQHYVRYLNYNRYRHQNKNSEWSVYTFIESDAKTQTLLYDLNKEQVEALKDAGDRLENLWITAARPVSYNENKILYKKVTNGSVEYFEYTNQDEPNLYEVRFSYMGNQKGSYQIKTVTAIGKIYEFAGVNQGDYEPKIRLTPPENRQYAGFKYHLHPNSSTDISIDALMNYADQNLFSNTDDADNTGGAIHLSLQQDLWHKNNQSISVGAKYDFTHQHFISLDPYRSVEFNREWQIDSVYGKQHLADISLHYQNRKNEITAGNRYFVLRDSLQSQQSFVNGHWKQKKWSAFSDFRYTTQKARHHLQAAYLDQTFVFPVDKYNLLVKAHFENREKITQTLYDSLNYQYRFGQIAWQKQDTAKWNINLSYKREQNDSIYQNKWHTTDVTDNISSRFAHKARNHQVNLFLSYRHKNQVLLNNSKDYLNVKFQWKQDYLNRFVSTFAQVESFNGNTLRDEVIFVETPPGQGVYQWNDYNGNGIKEINEFEIAVFQDQARYIRVILPSKNYIPTLNNSYLFQLTINPKVWQKKSILKKLYAVLKFENTHQSEQTGGNKLFVWQPKQILTQRKLWQQDWFWNRSGKKYKLHFTYQSIERKQLLTVGAQQQFAELWRLQIQFHFNKIWKWKQKFEQNTETNRSENYLQKNYKLQTNALEEGVEFANKNSNRFYTYFSYKKKENISATEKLKMYQAGLQYEYTDQHQNRFNLDVRLVKNMMTGNGQTPVAFQMLEGLQPGKNMVFTVLYKQKITSYLDLNLNYGFRLSEENPAIHNAGIQLKMIF